MIDRRDLVERLERLGDALEFDEADLADEVLAEIRAPRRNVRTRRWLAAAAAVMIVAAAVGSPDSRRAVARWFGFDRLSVEVDPALSVPVPHERFDVPGPGETRVVEVDGRSITVSAVRGTMDGGLVSKTVGTSDQIEEVSVQGHAGLWISGEPHQVSYQSPDGSVVVERVAENTLVWQDVDVLLRVEGFAELSDALAFVEGT